MLRGAFGLLLRDTAAPAEYARLFEPRTGPSGRAPSGLADWPRPFVFRSAELDGKTISPDGCFSFDAHIFDLHHPASTLAHFREAFGVLARSGLGAHRVRAVLERVEQLDLAGAAETVIDCPAPPCIISLDPLGCPVERVVLRFVTPTELKSGGAVAEQPHFAVLFGRLRDRLGTLRALYGPGPLEIDYRAMGDRAADVRLGRCDLIWEKLERRSSRTGQVHAIGGFTGVVEYTGALSEFLPWLRAARWVGVGRQTVWGKGEVRVVIP